MLGKQRNLACKKKKKNLASYRFKALLRWPDMKNGYQQAFHNQLFLGAYLHGKCVTLWACERVITCRVRAFTLIPEIRRGSQMNNSDNDL